MSEEKKKITVMIVDDEPQILKSLKRLLKKTGYDILSAESGKDAIGLLEAKQDIALIISDQRMPGMSGVEFLEIARDLHPHAARFLLTGYADMNAVIDSVNRGGINRYLSKPWNDKELVSYIKQAVGPYELKMENIKLNNLIKQQNRKLFDFGKKMEKRVKEKASELNEKNSLLDQVNEQLEFNLFNTVRAFAVLTDLSNPELKGHGQRVGTMSRQIAEKMNLESKEMVHIEIAGLLHDVGKAYMTSKKNKKHPEDGQRIVSFIDRLDEVGHIIKHHHENYDGSGYPGGLKESEIPLGSRIVAIADIYDRISHMEHTKNPYLRAMMKDKTFSDTLVTGQDIQGQAAIYHIRKKAFAMFDPDVVKTFLSVAKEIGVQSLKETKIPIIHLTAGMLLARALFTNTGRFLLPYKTNLTEPLITKVVECMKKKEIPENVYIIKE